MATKAEIMTIKIFTGCVHGVTMASLKKLLKDYEEMLDESENFLSLREAQGKKKLQMLCLGLRDGAIQ